MEAGGRIARLARFPSGRIGGGREREGPANIVGIEEAEEVACGELGFAVGVRQPPLPAWSTGQNENGVRLHPFELRVGNWRSLRHWGSAG